MVKRHLLLIVCCVLLLATGPFSPARAGAKKEMAFAVSLARKGLWNEATHRFRSLTQKHPQDARLWNNLAVAYEAGGRYDEAHEAYQKAGALPEAQKLDQIQQNLEAFEIFYQGWQVRQARSKSRAEAGSDADGARR